MGVNDLLNAPIVDWGMIMAAGVMITAPTAAFFLAVQRYQIQGWGAGGVQGEGAGCAWSRCRRDRSSTRHVTSIRQETSDDRECHGRRDASR